MGLPELKLTKNTKGSPLRGDGEPWMKRCLVLIVTFCLAFCLHSKEQERYTLQPTQNMWTFLKLDTATGRISHVQYGLTPEERFEYSLSELDITKLLGNKHVNGRYKLYPTKNYWNFILLDTIDGGVFQVQWGKECGVFPIPLGSVKHSEDDEPAKENEKDETPPSKENADKDTPRSGILDGLFQ